MRNFILITILIAIGWAGGTFLKNLITHTQVESYIAGCIYEGGDPIKCIGKAAEYAKQ